MKAGERLVYSTLSESMRQCVLSISECNHNALSLFISSLYYFNSACLKKRLRIPIHLFHFNQNLNAPASVRSVCNVADVLLTS